MNHHPDWHAFGLQPHRHQTFKRSPDPQLIDRYATLCLYMPSEHPWCCAVDEKSQLQAWTHTPLRPMQPAIL